MTKKGLLTKAERTALEKLLTDSHFKGKDQLKFLIWLNSTNPKFKKGDCFKVSDRGRKFFGVPAVNINGKITKIRYILGQEGYFYDLEVHVVNNDGRELTATMYADERELRVKTKNNENRIEGSGKYADCMDVCIGI